MEIQAGDVVHASPAISGASLFVGKLGPFFSMRWMRTGSREMAFQDRRRPVKSSIKPPIQASPVRCRGTVYFGLPRFHFYALDLIQESRKWCFPATKALGYRFGGNPGR